jgi:hypothetical protein
MNEPLKMVTVAEPALFPVSLNEAKKQLEIDDSDTSHDAYLQGLIQAATDEAERFTGRSLITRTYKNFWDKWPASPSQEIWWEGVREGPETLLGGSKRDFELPRPPLQSVTHVKTYDDNDTATTFSSDKYFVSAPDSGPGRIVLRRSESAPTIERVADGLEVQWLAGYGDNPGDVPEPIRHGILMTVAWAFTNRGDCEDAAKNSGAHMLWRKYRVLRL